jgi:zinc protease
MKALIVAVGLLVASPARAQTVPWDKAGIAWSKVPTSAPEPAWTPPRPTRLKLKNGMNLLVLENHRLPLVSMELVVDGAGSAQDPPGKSGLAAFTAEMLDEGAGGLTALELSAQVDQLGAELQTGTSYDAASVSVSTLTRTLDATIDLFAKVVTAPGFDDKEGVRVHDDWLTALKLRPDEPRRVVELVLYGLIYGKQAAYGRPSDGYLAEFGSVALADARKFYGERWLPASTTLIVVGDVETGKLQARLEQTFGAWKRTGKPAAPVKSPPARTTSRLWLVDRPGAEQADVRLGIYGVSLKDKRVPALDVLAKVLGGSFTSRLNHRLREELGWTYGAGASLRARAGVGPFVIATALVTPHAVEGVGEILRMVGELSTADVPEAELAKARSNVIRELPQEFATNEATASTFAWLVTNHLPDDYYVGYVTRIKKVTAKDVRALAKTLLPTGKLLVVVAGDGQTVRAGLEKLLGKAEAVSADLTPK